MKHSTCAALAPPRGFQRLGQPALELEPVHQARQRIVRGLVGHLPRDAAQLRDIVQHHHGTGDLLGGIVAAAQRRRRELDRTLGAGTARQQEGTPPEANRGGAAQRQLDRILQQLAVGFVDQRDHLVDGAALERLRVHAQQCRCGGIGVVDATLHVGGDQRLAQRFQRQARARPPADLEDARAARCPASARSASESLRRR